MAAIILPPSTPPLCSTKNIVFSPTIVLMTMPTRSKSTQWERETKLTCQAANITTDSVPTMDRRKLMNLLLVGTIGLPTAGMLVPSSRFFTTPRGGIVAKDVDGNTIIASEWLRIHGPGDKTLTQGLKGDPTYLVVENNRTLSTYGINAVCTHLGCIVPWNTVEKKFMCPCHGSQYNHEGKVIKGPAHLSLEVDNVDIEDDKVVFAPWAGTDFRTGDAPWWS